jgi:hypothetical protein
VTDTQQENKITARYLVIYDWPVTADAQEIFLRLKQIVAQLGYSTLPVLATKHGKKKSVSTDLFKIEDFSSIKSVEKVDAPDAVGILSDLYYSYNKTLDTPVLCIAIQMHRVEAIAVEGMIRTLNKADCIGYSIAFDAPLGEKAMYYALGITYGETKTHYEKMCADNLGRFFFQRTRKDRNDRAYNRDKIRNVYPVNVLNPLQKQIMQAETELDESRFTQLDEGKYMLVLEQEEVSRLREKMVGSTFLI